MTPAARRRASRGVGPGIAPGMPAGIPSGISEPLGPHPAGRADELTAELAAHVDRLSRALPALRAAAPTLARWGEDLGHRLVAGGR
ncbi:MAG: hypothetical protein QOK35_3336, partial [Pseudonocardiales bacterium]|nr:hypothetical protein [Pseudonocardiales bacterium]